MPELLAGKSTDNTPNLSTHTTLNLKGCAVSECVAAGGLRQEVPVR